MLTKAFGKEKSSMADTKDVYKDLYDDSDWDESYLESSSLSEETREQFKKNIAERKRFFRHMRIRRRLFQIRFTIYSIYVLYLFFSNLFAGNFFLAIGDCLLVITVLFYVDALFEYLNDFFLM